MAAPGIRVLAPAVFFACVISVYRGYAQGHENMIPTAVSQIIEVSSKAVFGIALALWLVHMGYESHIVSAGAIVGVTIGLGLCIPVLVWFKKKLDRGVIQYQQHSGDDEQDRDWIASFARNDGDEERQIRPLSSLQGEVAPGNYSSERASRFDVLGKIMKVSIPMTLSASFMAVMVVVDNSIVLNRLQSALGFTEAQARALFGMFSRALTIYNLPPSLVVPVSISIIPAIAAALAKKQSSEASVIMQSSVKLVNLLAMPASAGIMILAGPILVALYNDSRQLTADMLTILGAALLFVCLQFVTTAILQANGHERVALITFPVGAVIRIALSYFLAGDPKFGIMATPISTLVCFLVIAFLNIVFIKARIKDGPKYSIVFVKPLLCTVVMAAVVFSLYRLLFWLGSGIIGTGRFAVILCLGAAIAVGVAVYGVLIVITRTITMEDMKLLPKGEKLAKLLRVR